MFEKENIVKLFFDEPQREFHLREIARIVKVSSSTAKKYLDYFEKEKVILSKRERNLRIFIANTESRKFKQLKINYNILKIIDFGVLDFLEKELNFPTIILFGSQARGENGKNSDMDLFILTNSRKK